MYCKTTGMTGKTSIYMDAQYCMILVFSGFVLGQACGGLTALTSSDLVSGLALQRLCPDSLTGLIKHARSCFSLKQCG